MLIYYLFYHILLLFFNQKICVIPDRTLISKKKKKVGENQPSNLHERKRFDIKNQLKKKKPKDQSSLK